VQPSGLRVSILSARFRSAVSGSPAGDRDCLSMVSMIAQGRAHAEPLTSLSPGFPRKMRAGQVGLLAGEAHCWHEVPPGTLGAPGARGSLPRVRDVFALAANQTSATSQRRRALLCDQRRFSFRDTEMSKQFALRCRGAMVCVPGRASWIASNSGSTPISTNSPKI
jgi:hypothetical protein